MRRWVLRLPTQMDLPECHRWNPSHPTAMVSMTWPGIFGSGAAIGTGSMLYPARDTAGEQECVLGQPRSERELGSGGSRCAKTTSGTLIRSGKDHRGRDYSALGRTQILRDLS
jgi:hypothetical protein